MSRRPSRPGGRSVRRRLTEVGLFAATIAALWTTAACGAAPVERPAEPTADPTAAGSATAVPADGQTLAELGFVNGPIQSFSLPRTTAVSAASDQASLVTLVVVSPSASDLYGYLVRALPATGYEITARRLDATTPALTFTGHGWTGDFTGNAGTSALTLRPVT